jgi:hypothetical protein
MPDWVYWLAAVVAVAVLYYCYLVSSAREEG